MMLKDSPTPLDDSSIFVSGSQTLFGNPFKDALRLALLRVAEVIPKWNLGTIDERTLKLMSVRFNLQPTP